MKYFRNVRNYLNPGSVFVFDINTEYTFRNIFSNNVFYSVDDDFSYIWQNDFNEKDKMCKMDITMFSKDNELYSRADTVNMEKAYSIDYLTKTLEEAGLPVIDLYNDLTFEKPGSDAERVFFVCQRGA